ncbi:MAG: class I SAM-dependent methyltransferase [Hyphomicrobiales bacterium]
MEKSHWQEGGCDYALYRPTYPSSLAESLAEISPNRSLTLDVGCGTGQLTALLADHFEVIVGCDVSSDQLKNAVKRPNITYKIGSAEKIDVQDNCADLIVAAQAAHWFDLPAFYNEARRIGREGAAIALVTYGVFEVEGPASARVNRLYWEDIHSFWPKGRENVENGYRDFNFPFEKIATPRLNIEREWGVDHFINYCETWSAAKRAKAAGRSDIMKNAAADLKDILGDDGTMSIRWPISIRAGRL